MSTPCLAAVATAQTDGIGAAITIAHGHANTSNTSARCVHICHSCVTPPAITARARAATSTAGVHTPANRSTNSANFPRSACTSTTFSLSFRTVLSLGSVVTSTSIYPFCTTVPLITLSPTFLAMGTASPVSALSSRTACPVVTTPSARIISPALTAIVSPSLRSSTKMDSPLLRVAVLGMPLTPSLTAFRTRRITSPSISSAMMNRVTTNAASRYS
mmetsp:Transcript_25959/g.38446  ORF Transcript_25959/g.38446 Transcript_25959/m.38446 type:complete len:217 (-) Transcript_25959:710-1360(-)